MSKTERERIRMMFGGCCAYCGVALSGKWHVDHVEPVVRCYSSNSGVRTLRRVENPGSHRTSNLWPSCCPCNINKSSLTVEQWRKFLTEGPVSLASYNARFKHMLRFRIVTVNPEPFVFWFERYISDSRPEPQTERKKP